MVERIYLTLWISLAIIAAVVWLLGYMTVTALLAFGFVTFGLLYMGIIGVLPEWAGHSHQNN